SSCSASLSTRSRAARVEKPFDDSSAQSFCSAQRTSLSASPKPFLLDVDQFVEGPDRALVLFDHQGAERDGLAPMRVVDRSARLAVHQRNLAVLGLIVGDDGGEVAELQRLASCAANDGA